MARSCAPPKSYVLNDGKPAVFVLESIYMSIQDTHPCGLVL